MNVWDGSLFLKHLCDGGVLFFYTLHKVAGVWVLFTYN